VTVTAKIPEQLKKRLASLEVNVSELIRRALEQEVERAERGRVRKLADEAGRVLQKEKFFHSRSGSSDNPSAIYANTDPENDPDTRSLEDPLRIGHLYRASLR